MENRQEWVEKEVEAYPLPLPAHNKGVLCRSSNALVRHRSFFAQPSVSGWSQIAALVVMAPAALVGGLLFVVRTPYRS